ncbi:MAG: hypothetical protein JST83_12040 [Bacteroidetes bacterium]|nr:hypothetical protein [Bacteroidota bacterium]
MKKILPLFVFILLFASCHKEDTNYAYYVAGTYRNGSNVSVIVTAHPDNEIAIDYSGFKFTGKMSSETDFTIDNSSTTSGVMTTYIGAAISRITS